MLSGYRAEWEVCSHSYCISTPYEYLVARCNHVICCSFIHYVYTLNFTINIVGVSFWWVMSLLSTRPVAVCLLFTTERKFWKRPSKTNMPADCQTILSDAGLCGVYLWNHGFYHWSRTWTRFQQGRRRLKGRKFHFNTCLLIMSYSVVLQYLWLSGQKKLPNYEVTPLSFVSEFFTVHMCILLTCTSLYILYSL